MAITIGTSILLAILSAVLLILAFPKADLDILTWVGLVPLLVAIKGKALPAAYLLGFVTGLLFFGGFFYWIWAIRAFNLLDFILLELYLAQYFALFGCLLNPITRRTQLPTALTAPALWVSLLRIGG